MCMKVDLVAYTPEPERVLMEAVSKCYRREPSISAVRNAIKRGHTSVVEHVQYTFEIQNVSRALLAQLTRHRVGCSFTVESQRYVEQKGFKYVTPPEILNGKLEAISTFYAAMKKAEEAYVDLLEMGIAKEDARYVLPNACCTNLSMTMNLRALLHFWELRCDPHAQWEIRMLANATRELVLTTVPNLSDVILGEAV